MRGVATLLVVASLLMGFTGFASAKKGAQQVSGTAFPFPVAPETCDPTAAGPDTNYILAMPGGEGDIVGCLYGVSGPATQTPGGTISRRNTETFIGCLGHLCGSFDMTAHITSKWDGPPGPPPVDQIFGRCQHKIVAGSGTGDFEGITGRLDFKDIILRDANGVRTGTEFNYKGHLKF